MRKQGFTFIEMMASASLFLLLAGILLGAYSQWLSNMKRYQAQRDISDLKSAIIRYYLDTAQFPPGIDQGAIRELQENNANIARWRGPYFPQHQRFPLTDPWGQNWIFRTREGWGRIEVAVLLSAGRNRRVDSDLNQIDRSTWLPAGDDIAEKISSAQFIPIFEERTRHLLNNLHAHLKRLYPYHPPPFFDVSSYRDVWNMPLHYFYCDTYTSTIYSWGHNRSDDNSSGITICNNAQANRDDVYLVMKWNKEAPVPWEGGIYSEPSYCRDYTVRIINNYSSITIRVYWTDTNGNNRITLVPPRQQRVLNPAHSRGWGTEAEMLVAQHDNAWLDWVAIKSADLDGNCYVEKSYGN
ncbi:MAG: type II secretion system protein GspG [bacterium]